MSSLKRRRLVYYVTVDWTRTDGTKERMVKTELCGYATAQKHFSFNLVGLDSAFAADVLEQNNVSFIEVYMYSLDRHNGVHNIVQYEYVEL